MIDGEKYLKFYNLVLSVLFFCYLYACSTAKPNIETASPVDKTKTDDVVELKAKIDDLNNRIFVLGEQLESLKARTKEEARIKTRSAEEEIIASYSGKQKAEPVAVSDVNDPVYKEYLEAFDLFKNKEYSKSLMAFSSFVEKYPDSFLTDNAYYWLGESYYQQSEYTLAISEYLKTIKRFQEGSKAPYAMLKIAMSYKKLGEKKDSDAYFNGLISKYPNSRAAKDAIRVRSK